jgi:hypothetical protein
MTSAVLNVKQLKSDYAPAADAPRQNSRSEHSPFGELVMAAVDQSEVDEQAMQAKLPPAAVDHGDAPEPPAGEASAVESAPVNDGTERKDFSVDTELLGGTSFPRSAPTHISHISRSGNQGDEAWNGKANPAAGRAGSVAAPRPAASAHDGGASAPRVVETVRGGAETVPGGAASAPDGAESAPRVAETVLRGVESAPGKTEASPEVGVAAAPPQAGMPGEASNGAQQSPAAARMLSFHDVSAEGSAKAAVDAKEMLALRQITVPPSGAAGKSLATSGGEHDTAEDANDSTDRRSSSGERDVSAEAAGPDPRAVEMPVPPASEPPPPSGMRLATTPFDMTNHQQLNEELGVAGPRDGVLAPGVSATATH